MVALKSDKADAFIAAPPDAMRLFLVYGSDPSQCDKECLN